MKFENFWPELEAMVGAIAFEFGGKGRRYGADNEDFRQEFICWLLDHEQTVSEWLDPERDQEEAFRYIGKCLRNEGMDYLMDVKAQATGYNRDDLYFYTRGEVKALLPAMFDPEKWHEPPQSDGPTTKAPAEGGNWIATLADVAQAYEKLEAEDKDVLAAIHRDGWANKMLAQANGISEALMSYRHNRALNRLVKKLGGQKPDPMRPGSRDPWRGRHAVSSESARAYQSHLYEDGVSA